MVEHHRERYFEMVLSAMESLSSDGRNEEAVMLGRQTLTLEPLCQVVCRCLMEELMALGRVRDAVEEYERLRGLLLRVGCTPEEETQKVYFRAVRLCGGEKIPLELHQSGEDENRGENGARVCDFAFFRTFYTSAEYLILQSGLEIYNALFTIEGAKGQEISGRTMDRAVDGLMRQMKADLRRGSALTRCADNQLLAMISANGYEQACMICERQVETFYQSHPNFPVRVCYGVWQVGGDKVI